MTEHVSRGPSSRYGVIAALVALLVFTMSASAAPVPASAAGTGTPKKRQGCPHWKYDRRTPEPDPFYLPAPDADPFYVQPDPMPCVPRGTILDSREITFTPMRGLAMPEYPAWHLKFLSTDTYGNPIAAVATVVRPQEDSADQPLLAYQIAENSLGNACAPSHSLAGGTDNIVNELSAEQYLPSLTENGWALVLPDLEGPPSAYFAPVLGAHITLDAIRAARSFDPLGLTERSPVGLWGFSYGAFVTAWAASLQGSYAAELNIVGVASGGTPVDIGSVLRELDGNQAWFRLLFSVAIGVARVHPSVFPVSNLNDDGIEKVQAVKDGCVGATTDGSPPPSGRFSDYTRSDPWATPEAQQVFAQTALPQAGLVPTAWTYIYHAIGDEGARVEEVDSLVQTWCDAGARVTYNRMPGGDHLSTMLTGQADAMRFLEAALENADFMPLLTPSTTRTCDRSSEAG